ncbi:MAG: hypothetical protein DMG38_15520 [Acidobacteria bacterium]|nr:MAG: hypothetical protein DMG38_15520 [Acidobacteriota bacterium]
METTRARLQQRRRLLRLEHSWLLGRLRPGRISAFACRCSEARAGGFDFSYRLPWLRNWLTIYTDSLADDHTSRTPGSGSEIVTPYCAVCASTVPFKSNSTLTE